MRYGIVREIEGHPPPAVQRSLVEQAGCQTVLEDGPPSRASLRAQWKVLFDLKPGDELLTPSLDTLQMSTGELVLLFRKFDQTGVTLRIVGGEHEANVPFSGRARSLLALLAENEGLRPVRQRPPPRSRPRGKPLSRYQIDYANDLRRHGASLRMIGLLFQISPNELLKLMGPAGASPGDPQAHAAVAARRSAR